MPALPPGYRTNAAGLFVPEEISRQREVWIESEWRVIDRATKLLTAKHVRFQFACPEPGCRGDKIQRLRRADGVIILQCAHKDRIFERAF